jgi:signal peptidase II
MRIDIILFSVILAADRAIKIIVPALMDLHQSIPVIPGFFHITYVRNSGGAFGILGSWDSPYRRLFFILASVAALVLLYILYRQAALTTSRYAKTAVILIASGAAGNLYDRIATGEVVDFLDFYIGNSHWPAFNVADTAITTGAFLLGYIYLRDRKETTSEMDRPGVS